MNTTYIILYNDKSNFLTVYDDAMRGEEVTHNQANQVLLEKQLSTSSHYMYIKYDVLIISCGIDIVL